MKNPYAIQQIVQTLGAKIMSESKRMDATWRAVATAVERSNDPETCSQGVIANVKELRAGLASMDRAAREALMQLGEKDAN